MAVNKVVYGGKTVIDLTADTVTSDTLAKGTTAHNAKGEQITGTMESGGGGGGGASVETCTVTVSTEFTILWAASSRLVDGVISGEFIGGIFDNTITIDNVVRGSIITVYGSGLYGIEATNAELLHSSSAELDMMFTAIFRASN
jgi:hypothetical protein